jgi:hypothetical protein
MTISDPGKGEEFHAGRTDLLDRARELNPECKIENVVQFFREIDAATAVLQRIDTSSYPLPIAYDPHWRQDPQQ